MSWGKLSDDFFLNRKVQGVLAQRGGRNAILLYFSGLAYAAGQLTDGALADTDIATAARLACVSPRLALLLYGAGLWEENGSGALIHDYLRYNPSKSTVEKRREQTALRVQRWEQRQANAPTNAGANAVSNAAPVPSRPVPSPTPKGDTPPIPPKGGQERPRRGRRMRPINPGATEKYGEMIQR